MKPRALGRKSLVCLVILLVAAIPMFFGACGSGMITPATGARQNSKVTVSSIVPNSGPLAGGTVVVINGSNFSSATSNIPPTVTFGGVAATQVSIINPLQVKAITPAHIAGAVTVQVTAPGGTSADLTNAFTYGTTTFSVSSVSPISGPADGGTTMTITGANFQSGASVTIGGLAASSVTVSSSTTIQATTPPHSSGSVSVTVTNTDGQSATLSSGFTFHSVDLTWSAPNSSPVSITGYNIYRALSSGGPFGRVNGLSPVSSTSYSDGTVLGATTYFYEVKSVDSSGTESAPEGPVPVTTGP